MTKQLNSRDTLIAAAWGYREMARIIAQRLGEIDDALRGAPIRKNRVSYRRAIKQRKTA